MNNQKVAVLGINLGRYTVFKEDWYQSAKKNLFPSIDKHFFVFSDQNIPVFRKNDVTLIKVSRLGWPQDSMRCYHFFDSIRDLLADFDYIYSFNANAIFVKSIGKELLPDGSHDMVGAHNGRNDEIELSRRGGAFETNPKSTAYMTNEQAYCYYRGCMFGGTSTAFIRICQALKENIDEDAQKGITAIWHDESHINRYFLDHPPKTLDLRYIFAEEWKSQEKGLQPHIIMRDKRKFGGHDYLRGIRSRIPRKLLIPTLERRFLKKEIF